MNWIRVAVGIVHDPSIHALADAAGVSVPTTTGHVVGLLTYLPQHCRDGDLSGVADATIERWAMWTGKRGKFATAFRAHLCDSKGVVKAWEKHNGAAIREADRTKERAKEWREERKKAADERRENAKRTAFADRSERVANSVDGTGRDVTVLPNNNSKSIAPRRRSAPKAEAKFPAFSKALCDTGYQAWLAKLGAADYAAFRKAFAPAFSIAEPDRPESMPRDAEFARIIELYAVAIRGTKAAQFVSPAKCAAAAVGLTKAAREADAERRLLLARSACGTVEEQRRIEGMAA